MRPSKEFSEPSVSVDQTTLATHYHDTGTKSHPYTFEDLTAPGSIELPNSKPSYSQEGHVIGTALDEIEKNSATGYFAELHLSEDALSSVGREALAVREHDKQATEHSVHVWVSDFVRLERKMDEGMYGEQLIEYRWSAIPADDPFLATHRGDVILEAVDVYSKRSTLLLGELVGKLSGGEILPKEVAYKLITTDLSLVTNRLELFPDFKFGTSYIDTMLDGGSSAEFVDNWKLIEPECLQYAVDSTIEKCPTRAAYLIDQLPDTIKVSEQHIELLVKTSSALMTQMILGGRFLEAKSNVDILAILFEAGYKLAVFELLDDDLLGKLNFSELATIFDDHIPSDVIGKLNELGRLNSEEAVLDILHHCRVGDVLFSAKQLPVALQSCIFKYLVAQSTSVQDWAKQASRFSNLQEEDYGYILDHIDDMRDSGTPMATIWAIFHGTEGSIWHRFELEVKPMTTKDEMNSMRSNAKHEFRNEQRRAEGEYFKAGNIQFVAHEYDAELSDEEVIKAFENEHCVRKVGVFRDIASDQTRKNKVTCNARRRQMESIGVSVSEKNSQIVCTEYDATRQLLHYLEKCKNNRPDKPAFGEIADNLSYIGEREYAEAVRGIAVYWKWFLDKDSENQLYVDTVVTTGMSYFKSDAYMLDRILEHFSDNEMAKYQGRLLTKGSETTQDDPHKLKVVLLDDWTISGSQLREGYSDFVRAHPSLVSSVEVQLIIASAERVTMGIERISCFVDGEWSNNVPMVARAYYIAHKSDVGDGPAVGSRITGSHSSVDFGFTADIGTYPRTDGYPVLADVAPVYRQNGYTPKNIDRLKDSCRAGVSSDSDKPTLKSRFLKWIHKTK